MHGIAMTASTCRLLARCAVVLAWQQLALATRPAALFAAVPDTAAALAAGRQPPCAATAAEVPLLSARLTGHDPLLAEAARQALEGIPDPAAAAALRRAASASLPTVGVGKASE